MFSLLLKEECRNNQSEHESWKIKEHDTIPISISDISDEDNDYIYAPRLSNSVVIEAKEERSKMY